MMKKECTGQSTSSSAGGSTSSPSVQESDAILESATPSALSGLQIAGYGVGHFQNDLCASMWFTYLLLFLKKVLHFQSSLAGFLMLIGQITDALGTAVVGLVSDWQSAPFCLSNFGRRKSWHAFGTILVVFSFPFIFNRCFACSSITTDWLRFAWYAPFVIVFQIGWAAVQVSHLALLPEMTSDESRRTTMNSVRYGCSVIANLLVYGVLAILLHMDDGGATIGAQDLIHFSMTALIVIGLGMTVQVLFYSLTKEPSRQLSPEQHSNFLQSVGNSFSLWFYRPQFYLVSMYYVMCRLYINLLLVYFPFYITNTHNMSKKFVAILPMISYFSSLSVSAFIGLPFMNRNLSLKVLALFGCLVAGTNCVAMQYNVFGLPLYLVAILIGASQAFLLISSLSIVADIIHSDTATGAFVYGTLSSLDKISNGVALQVIELLAPKCNTVKTKLQCADFYRAVVVYIPGVCVAFAVGIVLVMIIRDKFSTTAEQILSDSGEAGEYIDDPSK